MIKRLAITKDGKLTYCTSDESNIGKGRCNHVLHQNNGEKYTEFLERSNRELESLKQSNITNMNKVQKISAIVQNKFEHFLELAKDKSEEIRLLICKKNW